MRMLWNLLEGEACIDFQFRKKVQCVYAPWLCVLPYLMRISEDPITRGDWSDQGCDNVNKTRIWQITFDN